MPLIQHENATHGDITMLPHLNETAQVANTVKSNEFFRFLASCENSWEFVSKIDDDSYLDTREFSEEFIKPLLENPQPKRTMIGRRLYHHDPDLSIPHKMKDDDTYLTVAGLFRQREHKSSVTYY